MALTKIGLKILKDSFRTIISGSFRGELSSSASTFIGGGVSGSVTSTGSFGRVEAAGVVFADSFKSVTGGTTIDFNDDVSLTGNLTSTGNVSGSITSTGSFGRVNSTTIDIDSIQGNWTNAGNTVADLGAITTVDINGGTIDGITSLTAGGDLDIGAHDLRAATLTADGLTSGRVVFAGTNGVLSDDSDLTFSGDTLSATKINATNVTGSVVSASNGAFTSIDVDGGTVDGITSLTAGGNLDIGTHDFRARKLTADNQTSGNVAIYSTAGLLSEDSDLTFSGATLSATNVTTTGTIKDFASVSGSYVSTGSVGRIQTRAADIGTITGTTLSTTGNISGSATSTGSFGRLQTQQGNASIGGNIVTLGGNLTTQNNNVTINAAGAARTLTLNESLTVGDGHDGTITFGAASKTLTIENTSLLNQDLTTDASPTFAGATITGTLTVQEIHTEFESASILFTSGSTQFGNSTDDVHNVTGSMKITGSFQVDNGTLTAGTVDINGGTVDGITSLTAGGDLDIGSHGFRAATLTADGLTAGRVPFAGTAGLLSDDSDLTFATSTLSATNLTTTGTIKNMALVSGSITSTGSFGGIVTTGTGVNAFLGGNIGVGHSAPLAPIHISKDVTQVSGSAASRTNAGLYLNFDPTFGSNSLTMFAMSSSFATTAAYGIQVANSAGTTQYPLGLQPFGGQVLIGCGKPTSNVGGYNPPALSVEGINFRGAMSVVEHQDGTSGGVISIGKSRGAVPGSVTIVQTDDIVGRLLFSSADGVDYRTISAEIRTLVGASPAANDVPGHLLFMVNDGTGNDSTERMRIASSGFVGIQTADTSGDLNLAGSFGAPLHVLQKPASQAYAAVFQGNSNANGARIGIAEADSNLSSRANTLEIGFDSSTDFIFSRTNKDLIIGVSGSEQMRIDIDGNVGIGTNNPLEMLDVSKANNGGLGPVLQLTNDPGSSTSAGTSCKIKFAPHHSGTEVAGIEAIATDTGAQTALSFRTHTGSALGERMRVAADGKVLIGSDASRTLSGVNAQFQIEGTDYGTSALHLIGNTGTDAGTAPILFFGRSRGTSDGTSTSVADDDRLGALFFCGADGTDINTPAATIQVSVDGTPGGNDMPGRIEFRTTADGGSATTERMVIKANGDVGIGETSPLNKFYVVETESKAVAALYNTRNPSSSPPHGLDINFAFTPDNTTSYFVRGQDNLGSAATAEFHIYSDGSFVQSSDRRKKENIVDSENQLDKINQLKVRDYNKINDSSKKKHIGFIAQELQEVFPHLVVEAEDEAKTLQIYKVGIVPLLVKAVQELSAKVEALENA